MRDIEGILMQHCLKTKRGNWRGQRDGAQMHNKKWTSKSQSLHWYSAGMTLNRSYICNSEEKSQGCGPFRQSFKQKATSDTGK